MPNPAPVISADPADASDTPAVSRHKPAWKFIPVLEFANGLIHDVSGPFLVTVFKTFGASNTLISSAWLLQLPLSLKAIWAPVIERLGTHRSNMLRCMLLTVGLIFAMSGVFFFLGNSSFLLISLMFLAMILIMSFVEISVKGYKVSALNSSEIALYSGISAAFFRLGLMFGSSVLIYLVGVLAERYDYQVAWGVIFAASGAMVLGLIGYLALILPYPLVDKGVTTKLTARVYAQVFLDFLAMRRGLVILAFLFLSRFGEGLMKVMLTPFVLDPIADGGTAIDLKILGVMGPFGLTALIVSGILGGIITTVFGLRKTLFLLFPLMFVPNLIYSYLAFYNDTFEISSYSLTLLGMLPDPWEVQVHWPLFWAGIFEISGYGMAFAPIIVLIDLIAKNAGEKKATFAAIGGSFLLLGFIAGGGISGMIQERIGYFWLFNLSFLVSLPAWTLALVLPLGDIEERSAEIDREARLVGDE